MMETTSLVAIRTWGFPSSRNRGLRFAQEKCSSFRGKVFMEIDT